MNEILDESRRPKCPNRATGCWYIDSNGRCANAGCVAKRLDPCRNNGWGMMPAETVAHPELDRDVWRKEHGL